MWGTSRLTVLIAASALGAGGWGAVLPYLYGDIATARGLGAMAAAGTFTAFALGSLIAAPIAGRLADTRSPATVAVVSRVAMALFVGALALVRSVGEVWFAAALTGAAYTAALPAIQVLLLGRAPAARRRDVFAWQFIANNLGIAAGGLAGGFLVTLSSPTGVLPAYVIAAATALASAAVVAVSGRGQAAGVVEPVPADHTSARSRTARSPLRLLIALTFLLMLACYAQLDAGLPAYAFGSLHAGTALLGVAVAVNCLLVAVLTAPVVRLTRHRDSSTLLATCAALWIGCWLLLGAPLLGSVGPVGVNAAAALIGGYGAFAFGETMLAPVLAPLAARLAPEGSAGRALGAVTGAQTAAMAVGPSLSGALLALGLPAGFIGLQVACCVAAIVLAGHLGRVVRGATSADERVHPAVPVLRGPGLDVQQR